MTLWQARDQGRFILPGQPAGPDPRSGASQARLDRPGPQSGEPAAWASAGPGDGRSGTAHLVGALADAVATANLRLQELIISDPAIEGMGTTLTALLWSEGYAALCHIGDSRAYLLRDGQLVQITHDHTLVQSLQAHAVAGEPGQALGRDPGRDGGEPAEQGVLGD